MFSIGIIGTGLLAIPVLAGASSYALTETLGYKVGLQKKFLQAKVFYSIILLSLLGALLLNFFQFNPIKALVWSATLNGVASVPILFLLNHMSTNPKIIGKVVLPVYLKVGSWLLCFIFF